MSGFLQTSVDYIYLIVTLLSDVLGYLTHRRIEHFERRFFFACVCVLQVIDVGQVRCSQRFVVVV